MAAMNLFTNPITQLVVILGVTLFSIIYEWSRGGLSAWRLAELLVVGAAGFACLQLSPTLAGLFGAAG
jgi:hypothetical protein